VQFLRFLLIWRLLGSTIQPIIVFSFFVLSGIYTILAAGKFVFNQEGVTHRTAFGMHRIHWKEVKNIEIGAADGSIVLHGENKRFILAPPSTWSVPEKFDAYSFFRKKSPRFGNCPVHEQDCGIQDSQEC